MKTKHPKKAVKRDRAGNKVTSVALRIPEDLKERMTKFRDNRKLFPVRPSQNTVIVTAIDMLLKKAGL